MVPETFVPPSKEQNKDVKPKDRTRILTFCIQPNKIAQTQFLLLLFANCIDMLHFLSHDLINTVQIAWANMGPTNIGIYISLTQFGNGLVMFLLTTVGKKYLNEHINMLCASISGILGTATVAFAMSEWMFYLCEYDGDAFML